MGDKKHFPKNTTLMVLEKNRRIESDGCSGVASQGQKKAFVCFWRRYGVP
ncbi:Bgt-51608, partial [Blumeria graminis f. sp. tritici]